MDKAVSVDGNLRPRALFALIAALLLLAACERKTDASPTTINATDPQWVSRSSPPAKVAVVFVHGVLGDTLGTWTHSNGSSMFQYLKASSQVGPNVDVFAFGFTSKMFGTGSLDIREASNKLQESLEFKEVLSYPAVVFVGHSMGGLVVLRYLISQPELAAKVPLVVLYAAPQEGAQIASIADRLARNHALAQMFPADGNGYLQQLSDDWRRVAKRPPVACGYETRPTYESVVVVPWSSATRFCSDTPIAIENADHIDIVKPDRAEHPSMVLLINALNRHVIGKNFAARLETPDFTPEGDHYTFVLDSNQGKARLINEGRSKLTYTVANVSDPSLYIVPDNTPKDLGGQERQLLGLNILAGPEISEYRFILRTDVPSEHRVIVRVPNVDRIHMRRSEQVGAVVRAMDINLAEAKNVEALRGIPAGDERALQFAAGVAFDAVKKESPWLAEGAAWVVTADVLAAANLPHLAVTALRRAEVASPTTAAAASTQTLAGIVAAQSGQGKIFIKTSNPPPATATLKTFRWFNSSSQEEETVRLATQLQKLPALRATGLSLQGDVLEYKGNKEAARKAYVEAASIEASPSITMRAKALDARGSSMDTGKHIAVMERPVISEPVNAKAERRFDRSKTAIDRTSERP